LEGAVHGEGGGSITEIKIKGIKLTLRINNRSDKLKASSKQGCGVGTQNLQLPLLDF
jgi:hypothetical protein